MSFEFGFSFNLNSASVIRITGFIDASHAITKAGLRLRIVNSADGKTAMTFEYGGTDLVTTDPSKNDLTIRRWLKAAFNFKL